MLELTQTNNGKFIALPSQDQSYNAIYINGDALKLLKKYLKKEDTGRSNFLIRSGDDKYMWSDIKILDRVLFKEVYQKAKSRFLTGDSFLNEEDYVKKITENTFSQKSLVEMKIL